MTTAWDYLPPDFTVGVEQRPPDLVSVLTAGVVWRRLTRPQRELLLSAAAGYPIAARADVKARMIAHGLIDAQLGVTVAGRVLVQMRPA